jgi:hypothetical protein
MGNESAQIMPARMFPDQQPPDSKPTEGLFGDLKAKAFFALASNVSNKIFFQVSDYLAENDMNVANYSIGVPMTVMAKNYLGMTGNKEPKPEEIEKYAKMAFKSFKPKGEKWIKKASTTLFVVAAGNDGTHNDVLPIFPASISIDNAITVAATNGYKEIAKFSNYSEKTVHVAAPGVAISSTVPSESGDQLLPMSGTSMAAPFVTMVASKIKDINPELTPVQIKAILMGTVDKKEWLADKVVSSGIVNPDRAYLAAGFMGRMTIEEALEKARAEVEDKPEVGATFGDTSPLERTFEPTKEMKDFSRKVIF